MKRLADQWIKSDDSSFIGKRRPLKNKVTKELSLFGKFGEIWEYSNEKIGVLVNSNQVASRHFGSTGLRGDEFLFIRPLTDLEKCCKVLKVPKEVNKQLKIARGKNV